MFLRLLQFVLISILMSPAVLNAASDSTKIGISVEIKGSSSCDYTYSYADQLVKQTSTSNCEKSSKEIVNDWTVKSEIQYSGEQFARLVMIVQ